MEPQAYRPVICPQCRADVAYREEEPGLQVAHCTTCGCTFLHHTKDRHAGWA